MHRAHWKMTQIRQVVAEAQVAARLGGAPWARQHALCWQDITMATVARSWSFWHSHDSLRGVQYLCGEVWVARCCTPGHCLGKKAKSGSHVWAGGKYEQLSSAAQCFWTVGCTLPLAVVSLLFQAALVFQIAPKRLVRWRDLKMLPWKMWPRLAAGLGGRGLVIEDFLEKGIHREAPHSETQLQNATAAGRSVGLAQSPRRRAPRSLEGEQASLQEGSQGALCGLSAC